tara:strand:+ start:275 stop:463 length:189 start_codon:yes stop_codon:yes gene_type:complete
MSENFIQWLNRVFIGKPNKQLSEMTKLELEAKGREVGIELDRRLKKYKLVNQLEKKLGRTHA